MTEKTLHKKREPFFHIIKRSNIKWYQSLSIKLLSIVLAFAVACLIIYIFTKASPAVFLKGLFDGCFSRPRRTWVMFRDFALLLIVGLALIPAFRMKFWNLGGNGQILISALVSVMCMYYLGNMKLPDYAIILISIPCSILSGAIWAVIPAIFKAFFNTNESLFTLMLNYVAEGLVGAFIALVVKSGSGVLNPLSAGHLPNIYNNYLLSILVAILLLIFVFVYLRFSKHGYELQVVGESRNTAKYIGINVKWVIIRTMLLSGALCGVVGLLLGQGINYTVNAESAKNMGFTAIMVSYLAQFNPITMVFTAFLITFINTGMSQVQSTLHITNSSIANIIVGLIYFSVIASEFFTSYRILLTGHPTKSGSKSLTTLTEKLNLINPFSKARNMKKEDK